MMYQYPLVSKARCHTSCIPQITFFYEIFQHNPRVRSRVDKEVEIRLISYLLVTEK